MWWWWECISMCHKQVGFTGCAHVNTFIKENLAHAKRNKSHRARYRHTPMNAWPLVCAFTETHTDEAVAHPLTGRWPDSPAAASCLMFHSEDHISLPDSSANKRKTVTEGGSSRSFSPRAAIAPLPDSTPSEASQHAHGKQCEFTPSKCMES